MSSSPSHHCLDTAPPLGVEGLEVKGRVVWEVIPLEVKEEVMNVWDGVVGLEDCLELLLL